VLAVHPPVVLGRAARGAPRPSRPLRLGVPLALAALLVLYLAVLWPWMTHWGATAAERTRALPGDELVPLATEQSTRAVTVHAPAAQSWRWLVQIGEDRAGFYSYTWLENLFGADIHNGDRVRPEWQALRAGDLVRAVPDGYLGGVLETPGWRVAAIDPGRWFVLRGWGVFLVEPVDARTSRVLVRTRFRDETWWGPVITRLAFGPVHFVMERRMLLGLRDRAEGRGTPVVAGALAALGFAAALAATALGLGRRRLGAAWLAPPTLLLASVLAGTGDVLAAAAGFIALGLVLLAVPHARAWWPVLVPVPALVLLVLLLAPDAYLAFGLLLLASVIVWLMVRRAAARRNGRLRDFVGPAGIEGMAWSRHRPCDGMRAPARAAPARPPSAAG